MNRFQRDTAVERLAEDRYAARIDRGWWIVRGPNGGYVAALLLRALGEAVGDPARTPRSLTVHYTSPPVEGPAEVLTARERVGRSLTTASARLLQDGKLRALAVAAFGTPRGGPAFDTLPMPEVVPPERAQPLPEPAHAIPFRDRFESLLAFGAPGSLAFGALGSRSAEATTGGWIRLREDPGPVDAPLLAAYTDAWPPAAFTRLDPSQLLVGVPTVDLTVHFRAPWPERLDPREFALAVFRSRLARDGFVEEDGEIWSRDGVLLAQSRQLAVLG